MVSNSLMEVVPIAISMVEVPNVRSVSVTRVFGELLGDYG